MTLNSQSSYLYLLNAGNTETIPHLGRLVQREDGTQVLVHAGDALPTEPQAL